MYTSDQETLTDLQWVELDELESFYRQKQFDPLEYSRRADLDIPTADTCCMTDLVWEDLVNMESIYRKYLSGSTEGFGTNDLEREHKECMTDLAWQELADLEESYRNYLEDMSRMDFVDGKGTGKGEAETVNNETMTVLDLEELEVLESSHQRYLEEKVSVKSRDDTETMTDIIWEELIERTNDEIYLTLSEELNNKLKEREGETIEVGIMTDLALSELSEMENKYLEYMGIESKVNLQKEEPVEALPEIVLDTFPEDVANKKDNYAMTELKWDDIVNLEDRCLGYERDIQELEERVAVFDVERDEKGSCTDMSFTDLTWNDIINLQDKCCGYECIVEELEKKLAQFEVERTEKDSSTELSLQDLADARFGVEMKDAETMTDATGDVMDNEGLPQIVMETFPGERETKDECDMTEGVWDEVVDLKNTYQDYRQNLEEMKQKLAQFEVEKDDKESITDIAMQDLADLESMYREHLRDADSDSNSLLSHTEKESRECMTELTSLEITELEDFYIENAARQIASSPIVEKWEQESMTDITLDEMHYLEETEELFRQKGGSAGEKDEKCTETDLTIQYVDYMQQMSSQAEFLLAVEKLDMATITELTITDLALLEDTQERHQSCSAQELNTPADKEDKGVATELTSEDLKYWEDVEAAHEECLLDREGNEAKAEAGSWEKQDAEIMTDFTMMDLQYLEEVDTAHEECLRDREEEGKADVEMLSVEIMTDLTVSDLKYLEDVELAHEECLVDKQEKFESRDVEKQNAEVMTDVTVSDLQYLEEVESAHEECLVDKQEEFESRHIAVEKESVEIMTDMSVSDLQYLEDVEAAHEECLVDKQEESKAKEIAVEKETVGIMTDMSVSDLQYLKDVEAAHEECLVDKQEEFEARQIVVEKESVEIMTDLSGVDLQYLEDKQEELEARSVEKQNAEMMTDMTVLDLQYLEEIEAVHEECLLDKQDELEAKDIEGKMNSVEIMTDLTVLDLQYLEDVETAHGECLAEKQDESKASEVEVETESVEIMTDLTVSDLQYLEDKQEELEGRNVEKQNAEIMTDLTVLDLQYWEEIEAVHEECLVDKHEELEAKEVITEKESVAIMTVMTISDLQYLEDVEEAHEECLADKQEESETGKCEVEKESVEIMTDLTISDLQYLEDVETAHEECLLDQADGEKAEVYDTEKQSVGTMTDMTNRDLKSLESASDKEKSKAPKFWRRSSRSSSVSDHQRNKNTMTEMTGDILQYFEDIEVLYKETVMELGEFKSLHSADKEEKDVMTELTSEDLKHLEEESQKGTFDDKEIMTELAHDDLEYLLEVESLYKESELQQEPRGFALNSDAGTMTELTSSYMEHVEEELDRFKREHSHKTDSSWVAIHPDKEDKDAMTEMTESELQYLEEVEILYKENIEKSKEIVSKDNAEVMTDLTTADLEYFEEAENLLKQISGNGGDIAGMLAPKDDKEVITDLLSSDIDHLLVLGDVYGDGNGEAPLEVEKDEKGTETELTIADIRDLEDQMDSATEVKAVRPFQEFVNEDFKPETLVDLQSELNYLPIFDEPEFISDEEDGEVIKGQETGVMTELTIADIRDLEDQVDSARDMKATPLVNEDFQIETLEGLQSQLEYLPVLDEPEFISDEETEREDLQRQDTGIITEITMSDLEHLEAVEKHLEEIQRQDNSSMTELTLPDLEYLEVIGPNHRDEVLKTPERSETGIQCELEDFTSLMQELSREAEEHGEDIPAWFVTALNMRKPGGGLCSVLCITHVHVPYWLHSP